jgi:large subunit ribosomal protein L25
MKESAMKVVATTRSAQGSGASRRLRRSGKVPGIVYGGTVTPTAIELDHNPLYHSLRVEAFHSSILDMELDGKSERVLLRDVQWHAYRPQVMHIDFQRVAPDRPIHMRVPLHFRNQEASPAVKQSAGIVGHVLTEIDITCLPKDLPGFIDVDLSGLEAGKPLHVRDIRFPEGVSPVLRSKENPVIVTVTIPGAEEAPSESAAAAPAAAKGAPAAKAAPAAKPAAKK